ncbi:hypothetical protein OG800_01890 [Streptomyces sp. NBC_00445]|uniref:hypothetical protein n=1 Tax=unclassified Streptomyces TaxID=2593676 RepID=UPI002E1F95BB|nr:MULTISPECIES: hypothetical protein [unclassified Streptomyces]
MKSCAAPGCAGSRTTTGVRDVEGGIEHWRRLDEATSLTRDRLLDASRALPGVRLAVES